MLGKRFEKALKFAAEIHAHQLRKGTAIPYISHLLAVTALVLEDGGDEDEAIAALLHDAAEDQGGKQVLNEIRRLFGHRVAKIVAGCSDTIQSPKPPWAERKEAYLEHLKTADKSVLRVSLADKLHNASTIVRNLRRSQDIWEQFKGGKEGTIWYYSEVVKILRGRINSPLLDELDVLVSEMQTLSSDELDA